MLNSGYLWNDIRADQYRNLRVVQGNATVQGEGNFWLVAANDCKHLAIEMEGEM